MEKPFKSLSELTPQELEKLQADQSHQQDLMSEEELQAELGDENESDSWGLIFMPRTKRITDEPKHIASMKSSKIKR